MSKKIYIDHDPEATFLYVLRLPDAAEAIFNENALLSTVIEIPTDKGIQTLDAQVEWTGNCRTRIKINGGSLLGASSARVLVKIQQEGITYTTDPIYIRMVG